MSTETISPSISAVTTFLADWKSDHRDLTEQQREDVGSYIMAIVFSQPEEKRAAAATELWIRFRNFYDGLRNHGDKTNNEDFRKAMKWL